LVSTSANGSNPSPIQIQPSQSPRDPTSFWTLPKSWGYNTRAKVEASIGRYKQVIGDGLLFRRDDSRMTAVAVAVMVMNRKLGLGQASCVRIA
jgi:hypothetical protein